MQKPRVVYNKLVKGCHKVWGDSNPITFCMPLWQKRCPFRTPLLWKGTPFTTSTNRLLLRINRQNKESILSFSCNAYKIKLYSHKVRRFEIIYFKTLLNKSIKDFPAFSYVRSYEIPSLLYTWSRKKAPLSDGNLLLLGHYGHNGAIREYPSSRIAFNFFSASYMTFVSVSIR